MDKISMILKMSREQQIQIEEHCLKEGLQFSDYFMRLHNDKINASKDKNESIKEGVYGSNTILPQEAYDKADPVALSLATPESCTFSDLEDATNELATEQVVRKKPGRPARKK